MNNDRVRVAPRPGRVGARTHIKIPLAPHHPTHPVSDATCVRRGPVRGARAFMAVPEPKFSPKPKLGSYLSSFFLFFLLNATPSCHLSRPQAENIVRAKLYLSASPHRSIVSIFYSSEESDGRTFFKNNVHKVLGTNVF